MTFCISKLPTTAYPETTSVEPTWPDWLSPHTTEGPLPEPTSPEPVTPQPPPEPPLQPPTVEPPSTAALPSTSATNPYLIPASVKTTSQTYLVGVGALLYLDSKLNCLRSKEGILRSVV